MGSKLPPFTKQQQPKGREKLVSNKANTIPPFLRELDLGPSEMALQVTALAAKPDILLDP